MSDARLADQEAAFDCEMLRIASRRETLGTKAYPGSIEPRGTAMVGLALSGGGIRSATFALGLLRALADAKLIPFIDILSTVSGGGYTGAFLCSHYVPPAWRGDVDEAGDRAAAIVFERADPFHADDGGAAFEHLRQSGRHLLPGGTGDAIRLAAMMTRNWLAVQMVIGLTLLAVYLSLKPVQAWLLLPPQLELEATYLAPRVPPILWPSQWLHGFPLAHWFVASPLWLIVAFLLVWQAGLFWAYFITRDNPRMARSRIWHAIGPSLLMTLGLLALGAVMIRFSWPPGSVSTRARALGAAMTLFASVAASAYVTAEAIDWWRTRRQLRANQWRAHGAQTETMARVSARSEQPRVQEDRVRVVLTNWNGLCLRLAIIVGALALLDSAAQTIYLRYGEAVSLLGVGGASAVAIPLLRQALLKLPGLGSRGGGVLVQVARRMGRLLALLAGVMLAAIAGTFWAVLAHVIAWRGAPIGSLEGWHGKLPGLGALTKLDWLSLTTSAFVGIAGMIAICFGFLNLSSYAHFYAARLRRAYLGASNPDRRMYRTPINADHVNDDIPLARYYDEGILAPLHLINVTINDTASGASNTVHRDRRGKPLTVSPAGYLYQLDAAQGAPAALGLIPFPAAGTETDKGAPEILPLSAWIGISGAAASTGVGQFGSLGLSLLAGLANIRLGRWWNPGAAARGREPWWHDLVQTRLADELIGRFPGSDGSRWNLTDGGHFEDSGAYELVRRRAAFIIVSDNGADPDYGFADLVTLTRRIKIDFDAELAFLGESELDRVLGTRTRLRQAFASLQGLGIGRDVEPRVGPYAALGRIRYRSAASPGVPDRRESTFLLIKPRVCGAEAIDLVAYAKANPPFPQQGTLDQFFDEAQWESYYSLGHGIGAHLFAAAEPDGSHAQWRPAGLRPLPD